MVRLGDYFLKRGLKKIKTMLSVLVIVVILFVTYAIVTDGKESGSGGVIDKEMPEASRELQSSENFNGYAVSDISVNMHEGEAMIQILNEENDVLWEQTFYEGTTEVKSIKLKNFDTLTVNTKCMNGEGEYNVVLRQKSKTLMFIDDILGK